MYELAANVKECASSRGRITIVTRSSFAPVFAHAHKFNTKYLLFFSIRS